MITVMTHEEMFGGDDPDDQPPVAWCAICGSAYDSDESSEYDGLCPACSQDARDLGIDPGADFSGEETEDGW